MAQKPINWVTLLWEALWGIKPFSGEEEVLRTGIPKALPVSSRKTAPKAVVRDLRATPVLLPVLSAQGRPGRPHGVFHHVHFAASPRAALAGHGASPWRPAGLISPFLFSARTQTPLDFHENPQQVICHLILFLG